MSTVKPPKIPESVLVVIHTPALDVLLIERADKPGFWQSVTGSKDARSHLIKESALPVGIPELERSGARQFVANNAPGVTNPASGPEAQESPARSIEDTASVNSAVLDQIIAAGGWPDVRKQAVRAALDEALFGKTRKWWLAFSLYYAEELNADPAFRQKLESSGYEIVPFGEPSDFGVINTCTVTREADAKSRKAILARRDALLALPAAAGAATKSP